MLALLAVADAAHAQEPPPLAVPPLPPPTAPAPASMDIAPPVMGSDAGQLEVHAFVSQGFIKSTHNNYLAQSDRGSLEMSEVGLNITKSLSDRLSLGVQLFARDLGPIGDYRATFDWFYLDYRLTDRLALRAGRVKLPVGLYNESSDVDSARVPILLPQSVYSVRNRDFLLAQTGFDLHAYLPLGGLGALDARLYLGTIYLDLSSSTPGAATNLDVPYVTGGRLLWEAPLEGLRIGGSLQFLRLDFDYAFPVAPPAMPMPGRFRLPVRIWVASLEYVIRDLLLAAEYSRWRTSIESDVELPMGTPGRTTSERYYALASYRLSSWLSPGLYYSGLYANVDKRDGRDAYQHDIAATLRFDITPNLIAKLEGHFMYGTADLQPNLNANRPRLQLTEAWGLFLLKLTAYF